ncbi:MAG: LysM peptidoglycan-binding domain-containing protein [Candidatus Aenigmarchaeota archaeon]|nr:LysM peptidoglycan-binding domain-containing protein [Candidatus Aenigmarchaeota archaeon]
MEEFEMKERKLYITFISLMIVGILWVMFPTGTFACGEPTMRADCNGGSVTLPVEWGTEETLKIFTRPGGGWNLIYQTTIQPGQTIHFSWPEDVDVCVQNDWTAELVGSWRGDSTFGGPHCCDGGREVTPWGECVITVTPSEVEIVEDPDVWVFCENIAVGGGSDSEAQESLIWIDVPSWVNPVRADFIQGDHRREPLNRDGNRFYMQNFTVGGGSRFWIHLQFDVPADVEPGEHLFEGNWSFTGNNLGGRLGNDFSTILSVVETNPEPEATTAATTTGTAVSAGEEYEVQSGDSLWSIWTSLGGENGTGLGWGSWRDGTVQLNNLTNPGILSIGQILILPVGT